MFPRVSLTLFLLTGLAVGADPPPKKPVLAFTFSHSDPAKAKVEPFPYFRVFPGGKDKDGVDASRTLSTLKSARGQSVLYKEEDAKPGLIVVLRRMLFIPLETGDYRAVFEGEFNAVQSTIKQADMKKLLSGDVTEILFASETDRGVRPFAFTIKPKTTFRLALKEDRLLLYGVESESTIIHYGLTRTFTYESDKIKVERANDHSPVYIGKPTPPDLKDNGEPETLPVLNEGE